MEPLFLCIVVITSVNGKEKAGGMCNGSSNDFNTGSRSSKHDLYDRYAGYYVRSDVFFNDPSAEKRAKRVTAMLNDMEVGDAIVTTGGFYGVIIDITDEDVIVEFGNNKNCRIPMKKAAIAEVEKASEATA